MPLVRSKLDCVLDQVPKDLLQTSRICVQTDLACGEIFFNPEIFLRDVGLTNFQSAFQQEMGIDFLEASTGPCLC